VNQDENRHLRLSPGGQALVDAIKTKRDLLRRLFRDVLGLPDDLANVDACKLEHLVSNSTGRQLVALFRYFDGGAPAGRAFLDDLHAALPACAHEPDTCPTCQTECLADKVSGK
jgi:Mn-dependent DtxR family transcriptional regulator